MKNMHYDAGIEFEKLARAAFNNCNKGQDPWGYTSQDRFAIFIQEPIIVGQRMLSTIFIAAIMNPKYKEHISALKKLENEVWKSTTQEQFITIIDSANELLELNQTPA